MTTSNFELDLPRQEVEFLRDAYRLVIDAAKAFRETGTAGNTWFVERYRSCFNLERACVALGVSGAKLGRLNVAVDMLLGKYCEDNGLGYTVYPFGDEEEVVELRWHNPERLHYLQTTHQYLEELCKKTKQ